MRSVMKAQFQEQGYLHLPGFFARTEVEAVLSDAKEVFGTQMRRHGLFRSEDVSEAEFEAALYEFFRLHMEDFVNCGKQAQHLISLHRLSLESTVVGTLRDLGLDFPNISTRPVLFFNTRHLAKKEVYWKVFPHQDWRSMQGSLDAVVLWTPLVDIDIALGALEVVPGSHRAGLMTVGVEDSFGRVEHFRDEDFVPVETRAGDALFFSSFLVHRSGHNATESVRWSCHFRYNNLAEETFIGRGYPHPYIYKPQESLLTPDFPSPPLLAAIYPPPGPTEGAL